MELVWNMWAAWNMCGFLVSCKDVVWMLCRTCVDVVWNRCGCCVDAEWNMRRSSVDPV